jgi:molybdenum cofactor cytidylyltransferase
VKIAGVVLAAGASTRLGKPKQMVVVDGEMLVERAVRLTREARLSPAIIVVGPDASFAEKLHGCMVVVNEEAQEGMAASIRCGVHAAMDCDGVVLMTCDQPALKPEHLRALCAMGAVPVGSVYAGKIGIPAYFPGAMFGELMKLKGDVGARDLLRNARGISAENLSLDIDTEEDIARLNHQKKCDPRQR